MSELFIIPDPGLDSLVKPPSTSLDSSFVREPRSRARFARKRRNGRVAPFLLSLRSNVETRAVNSRTRRTMANANAPEGGITNESFASKVTTTRVITTDRSISQLRLVGLTVCRVAPSSGTIFLRSYHPLSVRLASSSVLSVQLRFPPPPAVLPVRRGV